MPKLAIVIVGSANSAFYSQIAAISVALRRINWRRWEPMIYAFLGDHNAASEELLHRWVPHLSDVHLFRVSSQQHAAMGDWAQCDAAMRHAPRDADIILALDADTLPVGNFEDVLDRAHQTKSVAGVIAHYPPFPPGTSPRAVWETLAEDVISAPLTFNHSLALVGADAPTERRLTPFYVNGGVIFYPRTCFDAFLPRYLTIREKLMEYPWGPTYSSQVAFTLALTAEGISSWALPLRYNYPNDPRADSLYPDELRNVVIFHYQRTDLFDRHKVFASASAYENLLGLELAGSNLEFQRRVRSIFGTEYPFS